MSDRARAYRTASVDLQAEVTALIRHAAVSAIMPRFGQLLHSEVDEKSPGEVVTVADQESEAILAAGLPRLLSGSRVVGEEACGVDPRLLQGLDKGLVWIVDPLDGTANFAAGHEPFGVIVALADRGSTIAAWLYNPVSDRMCTAALGQGAFVQHGDEAPRQVLTAADPERPVAALATQFMPPPVAQKVIDSAAGTFDLRPIPRCAAEHYPMLARCENHVALFQRTLPWDHAAGALFLGEAGGVVSRWDGTPYRFHEERVGIIAASSPELWRLGLSTLVRDSHELSQACARLSPPRRLLDSEASGR